MGFIKKLSRGPKIEYIDLLGNQHTYFSDFKIKNTSIVFEIKSSYTWEKNLEINLLKKQAAEKLYDYYIVINNNFKKIKPLFK